MGDRKFAGLQCAMKPRRCAVARHRAGMWQAAHLPCAGAASAPRGLGLGGSCAVVVHVGAAGSMCRSGARWGRRNDEHVTPSGDWTRMQGSVGLWVLFVGLWVCGVLGFGGFGLVCGFVWFVGLCVGIFRKEI